MKLIILAALLATEKPAEGQTDDEACASVGHVAEMIMVARQAQEPLSDTLKVADQFSPEAKEKVREIVLDAYREPAFFTPTIRERAIDEFRNKWELKCHEAMIADAE